MLSPDTRAAVIMVAVNDGAPGAKPNVEILSIHVPKTAGITFSEYLKRVYGPESVLVDNRGFDEPEIGPRIRVLHGHFPYFKWGSRFPSARAIIWLRDPLRRLISHYYYWITLAPEMEKINDPLHRYVIENRLGFLEFCELPAMRNLQTALTGGRPIEAFDFVGIHEYLEDLCWLQGYFGWPDLEFISHNHNTYPRYLQLVRDLLGDPGAVRTLKAFNEADIDLLRTALALRKRRR